MSVLKYVLIVAIGYVAYENLQAMEQQYPFEGTWQSDKSLTMSEAMRQGVTDRQKSILEDIAGTTTLDIGKESLERSRSGVKSYVSFEVVGQDELQGCWQIRLSHTEKESVMCVENDVMRIAMVGNDVAHFKDVYRRL